MEIGILGGGIAGLSVALALSKRGYSPRDMSAGRGLRRWGLALRSGPTPALC